MTWQEVARQAAAEERARFNLRYTRPPVVPERAPAWDDDSPEATAARRRVLVRDFRHETARSAQ